MDTPADALTVLAVDDLALLATAGFFVPAAIITAVVAYLVVRDRRRDDGGADDG